MYSYKNELTVCILYILTALRPLTFVDMCTVPSVCVSSTSLLIQATSCTYQAVLHLMLPYDLMKCYLWIP